MAEAQERLQQEEEEVNIGQVIKLLQCLDAVFTENRNVITVLPQLHRRFVELEANMAKGTGTVASDNTGELTGNMKELEDKREQWQTQQERKITHLEKQLNEANQKIMDLEVKNKQNDNDVEMLRGERAQSDKNYYRSKYKDLKAKLRKTNEDLKTKQEKIAELGSELLSRKEDYDKETQRRKEELAEKEEAIAGLKRELRSKQEDYDKETEQSREALTEKENALTKTKEELDMVKQQKDESFRDQKTKIDELDARIAELGGELLSKQEELEKEMQRNEEISTANEKTVKLERERVKQHYIDALRAKENKLKTSETKIENLNTEVEKKKGELRHYMERFKQQEEKFKSDLSLKEMEVNKLKQRFKQKEENYKSDLSLKEMEMNKLKQRLAGVCEKRVNQDQRMVENILALNQQSEVENDFREFFDSNREDARDIIQSMYGSEEEIDVHVYYPRIACTIFETAYEHSNDAKNAVIDLFEKITKTMIQQAPEMGRNFIPMRKDGNAVSYPISIDDHNSSEKATDVFDALLISLKETSHICNLECLEKDVMQSAWEKWNEWYDNTSFIHSPSMEVLTKLDGYIKACLRLAWRMVTQLPPLRLEYQSPNFDCRIHKTAYHYTTEREPGNEETSSEEIACYLWPGLFDGGARLIRPGEVLCKMKGENCQ